jgi:hypothetical protein
MKMLVCEKPWPKAPSLDEIEDLCTLARIGVNLTPHSTKMWRAWIASMHKRLKAATRGARALERARKAKARR